ncbi:MAG: zf-TFIIB domain-containing protein, partial [Chloroflexi bacterium]|nr:zf-TFIIB domain-containing protein [Chloroflexota bacterium]
AHNDSETLGECPACGGKFGTVQVGPYQVDRCGACSGVWLDERELEKILAVDHRILKQKRSDAESAAPKDKKGKCPRCGGTLIKMANLRANINTDSCSVCYGMFLDAGELDALDQPNLVASIGQLLRKLIGRH